MISFLVAPVPIPLDFFSIVFDEESSTYLAAFSIAFKRVASVNLEGGFVVFLSSNELT